MDNLEDRIKAGISSWLTTSGITVFWEKKNGFGYEVFKVRGLRTKPDLLLFGHTDFMGNICAAVEVKPASEMLDGIKARHYCMDASKGRQQYMVGDLEVKPDMLLVASEESRLGRLIEKDSFYIEDSEMSANGLEMRTKFSTLLPRTEYVKTAQFIRQLWREWKKERSGEVGLGALLSSTLDTTPPEDQTLPAPRIQALLKINNPDRPIQWRQSWLSFRGGVEA